MTKGSQGISRRSFFATVGSAVAAGAVLGQAGAFAAEQAAKPAVATIPARRMGRTNLMIGVIAGNESMGEPALLEAAMEAGVNYWHKGGSYLVEAAKKFGREKQYIEICLDPSGSADGDVKNFKSRLGKGFEYADFYKIHGSYDEASVEAYKKLKSEGLVKYLSASFHGYEETLKALKTGNLDQVQISGNAVSGEPLAKVLAAAKEADAGVILMKTMQGGKDAWAKPDIQKALAPYKSGGLSDAQAAVAACLAMDGVTALTVSTNSLDRFAALADAAKASEKKTASMKIAPAGAAAFCSVCGACKGACPNNIAVQDIMRAEMYALGYREHGRARELYASIDDSHRANVCAGCGSCKKACPYRVASPERIRSAAAMLA